MNTPIELNEQNFDARVLHSPRPMLVEFGAEWCGPCKMLAPVLHEIAAEQNSRATVGTVNVDQNHALAVRFSVVSLPTLLFFANGEIKHRITGLVSKKVITDKLAALGSAPANPANSSNPARP